MGQKRTPGLIKRGGVWHVDKWIKGHGRLCESTGTSDLDEAAHLLNRRLAQLREERMFGRRRDHSFRQAATKYLNEHTHKRSLERDARSLKSLDRVIGDLPLARVHQDSLRPHLQKRLAEGITAGTLNRDLAVVRRILILAARAWRDEQGMTWLETAPLIRLLPNDGARRPYPLTREEQQLLFSELAGHLARMALFKVNTGTREQEVVQLRWEWEIAIPDLETSVFVVPSAQVKNKTDRVVVLNDVAKSVIDSVRGEHPEFVFTRAGNPLTGMNNSGWKAARRRAAARFEETLKAPCPSGFRRIRMHDLKHTFGRRLRAACVSFEDRQDLLGHKSARITTHYSAAEITTLIEAANKVCQEPSRKSPALLLLRSSGALASAGARTG
jgi:integrase